LNASGLVLLESKLLGGHAPPPNMGQRFLPADDPVLEDVLNWTVERDAMDIRRLLEWLPQARSSKERRALLSRVHELLTEVEVSLDGLERLH
jgi:hypothetical protein